MGCLRLIMNSSFWWDDIMISMKTIISVKWHWSTWNLAFLTSLWYWSAMLWFINISSITLQAMLWSMTPYPIQIMPSTLLAILRHLSQAWSSFCRKTFYLIILIIFVLLLRWLSSNFISVHRLLFRFTFNTNVLSPIQILDFMHHLVNQLIFLDQILFLSSNLFIKSFNRMILFYQFQL